VSSTERDNCEELALAGAERSGFPWVSMRLEMLSKFKMQSRERSGAFNISAPARGPAHTQRSAPADASEDFHAEIRKDYFQINGMKYSPSCVDSRLYTATAAENDA